MDPTYIPHHWPGNLRNVFGTGSRAILSNLLKLLQAYPKGKKEDLGVMG